MKSFSFLIKKSILRIPVFERFLSRINLITQQLDSLQVKCSENRELISKLESNIDGVSNDINTFRQISLNNRDIIERNKADIENNSNLIKQLYEKSQIICDLTETVHKQSQMIEDLRTDNQKKDILINSVIRKNEILTIQQKINIKKIMNIPIKIVFLIEEPQLIKNMLSLIEELNSDKRFEVILVNLWFKQYNKDGYIYRSGNLGAILDVCKYTIIESYNKEKDEWLNLEALKPDYVFYSRPYDYYRKESYHIQQVSKYSRTCYIPYGIQTVGGEIEKMTLTPECQHLYYFFLDNALRKDYVHSSLGETDFHKNGHAVYLGYPGIDLLMSNDQIKNIDSTNFNILWLPRWNSSEGNCHFFDYKDVLIDFADTENNCTVTLRPHPLCFENFLKNEELTQKELLQLREKYSTPHTIDENESYIPSFTKSSVLVADETSLIAEYFLTEKPIVFCKKQTHFSALMEILINGCYVVENKTELLQVLKMLKKGDDPLKSTRKSITEKHLTDLTQTAAINIKEELLADFNAKYIL